jgi:hypothetical protein
MGFIIDASIFTKTPMTGKSKMFKGVTWEVMPVGNKWMKEFEEEIGMKIDVLFNAMSGASEDTKIGGFEAQMILTKMGTRLELKGWDGLVATDSEKQEATAVPFNQENIDTLIDTFPMVILEWMNVARTAVRQEGN